MRVISPSSRFAYLAKSCSHTTRPSTASPRNSSRSLEVSRELAPEAWVRAERNRSGLVNRYCRTDWHSSSGSEREGAVAVDIMQCNDVDTANYRAAVTG